MTKKKPLDSPVAPVKRAFLLASRVLEHDLSPTSATAEDADYWLKGSDDRATTRRAAVVLESEAP